jgi:hypothetical protein
MKREELIEKWIKAIEQDTPFQQRVSRHCDSCSKVFATHIRDLFICPMCMQTWKLTGKPPKTIWEKHHESQGS